MRFSSFGSVVGAGLVGLSQASPVAQYVGTSAVESRTVAPCAFELAKNAVDEKLYKGVVAPAIAGVQKEIDLVLGLAKADIAGAISVEVTDKFLIDPTIKINLGGVKVYLEVDLEASAAVSTSVELLASTRLDLALPGLLEVDAGVAFGLDLTLALSAAIDVEAGVYLTLPDLAFVEISLLTKEIVNSNLEGLVAQALPITLGADVDLEVAVDLTLGLRLRTAIGIEAGLDILGLDIGAGAEVAVWINLFDYTTTLVEIDSDDKCPISGKEAFALVAGVAVELDATVGDILDFHLAPSVLVTLATGASVDICLPGKGTKVSPVGNNAGVVGASTSAAAGVSASSTSVSAAVGTGVSNVGSSALAVGTGVSNVGPNVGSSALAVVGGSSTSALAPVGSGVPQVGEVAPGAGTGYTSNSAGSLVPTGTGLPTGSATAVPYGNSTTTGSGDSGMVTSTVTTTAVYTVTSCAASVPNCPGSLTQKVVTSTVDVYTTVCPATMTTAVPTSKSSYSPSAMPTPTGTPASMTPCATPTTSTYVAPTNVPTPAPTVTIVDTTTVCPETETGATKPTGTNVVVPTGPAGSYTQVPPKSTGAGAPAPIGTGYPAPAGTGYPAGTGSPAPAGTGAYTPTYVTPKPTSSIVTAGAGKVAGGVVAVVLPMVAALML